MGAIVDTLFLGEDEILIIKKQYTYCKIINLTDSTQIVQQYGLIVPNTDLDDLYYNFLVDNCIAMSSTNFVRRLESDRLFTERMRSRVPAVLKKTSVIKSI